MEVKIILGPPGTGKTTKLLSIVDEHINNGVSPDRIAYVSFTKKAAQEAVDRAVTKFGFNKSDLPYFRTIHSLCYQQLNINRNDVMQRRHWKEFGALLNIDFSAYIDAEAGAVGGATKGDQLLFVHSFCNATGKDISTVLYDADIELNPFEVTQFTTTLNLYKDENSLLDFGDMLDKYALNGSPLDIDVAIIDEAQDLSSAQWAVARKAFRHCKFVYIAGDDEQCIFQWSGADIDHFMNIKGEVEVLEQSYRLPRAVWEVANKISKSIIKKRQKKWHPRDADGKVEFINNADQVDLSKGNWLLLARNNYMLKDLEAIARDQGVAYTTRRGSSVKIEHETAIRGWERLRKGKAISGLIMKAIVPLIKMNSKVRAGFEVMDDGDFINPSELPDSWLKKVWFEAFMLLGNDTIEYYLAILRNGNQFKSRIHISSIHGVKGGEADNVLLLSDMSARCYHAWERDPDGESRVFYVGATRARESLYIAASEGKYSYGF